MNRIILIGNGFDLAHGLKTGYQDFMSNYWIEFAQKYPETKGGAPYEDDFVKFENTNGPQGGFDAYEGATYLGDAKCKAFLLFVEKVSEITSYTDLRHLITEAKETAGLIYNLTFKNSFWEHLAKASALNSWLDIENEYYLLLKGYLSKSDRSEQVKKLNKEFDEVKNLLEKYLIGICRNYLPQVEPNQGIIEHLFFRNGIEERCVALSKRIELGYRVPEKTLVLNFNYTPTFEKLYGNYGGHKIINIHGELRSSTNPIIFGYGDEMDVYYQEIERSNDNGMLDNMKHIDYLKTENYRSVLEFLQEDSYQVFVMGHSCGNSDRTLLNTIFEHPKCASVMPFYHQWEKDIGKPEDDFIEICKNISRCFKDKQRMRDIVVNKTYCKPHPQNSQSEMSD